ncbi:MAG: PilZ domain-containing protein [Candidatus Omnitrophota bacterium]
MINRIKKEKRLHPRIDHRLPLKIAVNGYDFSTTTENVSCTGAYCCVKKYVPPFTKIAVKMTLPVKTAGGIEKYTVDCKGVIVRTDDESSDGFNIAIFFNEINEAQKRKIAHYISQFLPQQATAVSAQ